MSIAGVRSNRGDGYQTLVAFDWALSVLADDNYQWLEIDSTSLEANGNPISVDDVVVGCTNGNLICCQCKKNQKGFEPWTVPDLADELIKSARLLFSNPKSQVKFYTRGSFGAIAKLREHAITQPTESAYLASLTQQHQKTDIVLTKAYASSISNYELLWRTTFEVSPELERMRELLMERLTRLVSNAPGAYAALWTQLDNLGARIGDNGYTSARPSHRLTKADLQNTLADVGANFIPPLLQQDIQKSFANTSAIGRHWRRDIAGNRLHVSAVNELISAIETKEHSVLLTGIPGSGKTCLLLDLQEALEIRNDLAALFIQAREYANCATPEARTSQGFPEDIVGQVGRMADYQHTVVIIDSLDVLSVSREHNALLFFLAQIDRLLLIPHVTVIAACRDFDRKYDSRLTERKWDKTIIIAPLDWESVVAPLVCKYGIHPDLLDTITQNLLKNPRELALFIDIAKHTGSFNIATSQALSRKYLETIVQFDPALGDVAMIAIERMANQMLISRRLDMPRSQTRMSDNILKRLLSAEVLHENQSGNIEFGHQTLLDVLVVSGAERDQLSLKELIAKLPAVPFVRPTIRAYVAYLAAGNRKNFRKQLRAVFDSHAAFHIRRLVAESLAEQIPQDDDWSLVQHLHRQHRELFNSVYGYGGSIEWHKFWLKFFVPYVLQERDTQSLAGHVYRIAFWKKADPKGVLSFWSEALSQDWADRNQIAWNLAFELRDFEASAECSTASLIETLLTLPRRDHDSLGHAVARCVEVGAAGDDLLWRYITRDIQEDLLIYDLYGKLRCGPHEFGDNDFLQQRMLKSERLLDLAIASVEQWSRNKGVIYSNSRTWFEAFLDQTSYGDKHTRHDISFVNAQTKLFIAIENAILYHAKAHNQWWLNHRQALCHSYEGALRYIAILALTESPERNIAEVERVVLDKQMMESSRLRYEIGTLLHTSFLYLDERVQDAVLSTILTLWKDEDLGETTWILKARAELLAAIPTHLRSPEVQAALDSWEQTFGTCIRQPYIYSTGGTVAAPFSYERFLNSSDIGVLNLLSHYSNGGRDDWEHGSLVGGAEQVEWQLQEAASRCPVRFMRLLVEHWCDIPDRFTDDILDGAATYLAYRYGHCQPGNQQWTPIEEPAPQILAGLILDEIERHPSRWHHCRAAAKALKSCANVVEAEQDASSLLFAAIGFLNYPEESNDNDSRDLINIGINMTRGDVAEAVVVVATKWAQNDLPFPELLIPTLRRYARDPHPAIRAIILWRLPYLQSLALELGWDIFHLALEDNDENLWKIAEPCLYYTYYEHFSEVSDVLERLVATTTGRALEAWGRISALADLSGYIDSNNFIVQLQSLNSLDAWKGTTSVWSHKGNITKHREKCFFGIRVGLKEKAGIASVVAKEIESLFQKDEPFMLIPSDIIDLYFSIIEQYQSDENRSPYGFDNWLNAASQHRPDETLIAAERFSSFIGQTKYRLYDHGSISQLLTRLFREAEEREEADDGAMLRRVITLQDGFLAIEGSSLHNWLRDAERP